MKTLLLSIILSVLLIQSNAQQTKFNIIFAQGEYPAPETVFASDSSYYVLGPKSINNRALLTIWKFDNQGGFVWEKSYGDTISQYIDGLENSWIKADGNRYAATGNIISFSPNSKVSATLYSFNNQFDTLWVKKPLTDTVSVISYGLTQCSDGGFAMVGSTRRDEATGEVLPAPKGLLIKTDSIGNYLWHKTYGTWNYGDVLHKIVQTHDGGFLCGGATRSYSSSHNWDWYLVKTDSLGNEEWNRTYGNTVADDSRVCGITLTRDTNYVITGSRSASGEMHKPYIKVLNKDFQAIITKTLPYMSVGSAIFQTIELSNGDFIAIGSDRINSSERAMINLRKFDSEFNELWYRNYTAYDTVNVDNYMASVDTCSDGGYVIGGWAAVYDGNGQRLSLIKTDSMGCDGTDWWDCSTGVMIKEYANSESFKLYPNPANSYVVVESSRLKVESLAVYDLMGKIVKTILLKEGTESQTIDVSDLQSGIYLMKVGELIEKLVVK